MFVTAYATFHGDVAHKMVSWLIKELRYFKNEGAQFTHAYKWMRMLFLDYANRWRHFNPTQEPPMLWQMDAHTTKFHSWMKFQAQTAQLEDHRLTWDREPDEYKPRVSNPRNATDTDSLATLKA